jgi:hypothetical protein
MGHPLPFTLVTHMNPRTPSKPAPDPSVLSPTIVAGLSLLARARDAAVVLKLDPRDLAVDLPKLIAAGLSVADVRWIVAGSFAERAQKPTPKKSGRRSSRRSAEAALTARTCLVLTPAGEKLVTSLIALAAAKKSASPLVPDWDGERRQLRYGGQLVKWYRLPAICQETLLAAFQEDGWPPRIDDPLPRLANIDPKSRLHEAVRRLNYGQRNRLLAFYRDGTGEGVTWGEYVGKEIRLPFPAPSSLIGYHSAI